MQSPTARQSRQSSGFVTLGLGRLPPDELKAGLVTAARATPSTTSPRAPAQSTESWVAAMVVRGRKPGGGTASAMTGVPARAGPRMEHKLKEAHEMAGPQAGLQLSQGLRALACRVWLGVAPGGGLPSHFPSCFPIRFPVAFVAPLMQENPSPVPVNCTSARPYPEQTARRFALTLPG